MPFADANYYTSRSTIAIPRPDSTSANKGINLDDFFMFPQAMAGGSLDRRFMPAFQAQDLLIVHATGQLNNSRSHFDAQRYMEVGKPVDPSLVTGWLGPPSREHSAAQARRAAPRASASRTVFRKRSSARPKTLPIADPTNYSIGGSATTQAARIGVHADATTPAPTSRCTRRRSTRRTRSDLLKSVNFTGYKPANGAVYPNSSFGRALRSVAVLIKNDVGIEAAQVDIGGWDTHSAQDPIAGSMFKTMQDFSNSLARVLRRRHRDRLQRDARRGLGVRPQRARERQPGTDHGRGTAMFAMGKGIAGGRVLTKNWPGLANENLESGQDLKVTVDYRDILAEIVQNAIGESESRFRVPDVDADDARRDAVATETRATGR